MTARPVPRNIDKPNRMAEYTFTSMGTYFGVMFIMHDPLVAIGLAIAAVYFIYKVTLDKPEGQSYRLFYKYFQIGRMVPTPRWVRKFEI